MKSLLSTCAALALAGALFVPAALAQTVVTPRQEALGLPSGPYLLNCTGVHAANGSLVALCDDRATATQDAMDTWHTTQMPLAQAQQCNGAIVDMRNGRLACGTPAMVAANMGPLYTGTGTAGQMPMVGSSMAPQNQNYGSSFGTSGPTYGSSDAAMTESPATPPYATGASGYSQGQPAAPAAKPYYSGSSMAPQNQNYGSSYGTSGAPYGTSNHPYHGRIIPGVNGNQPIGTPGTPSHPA
jgi:hypothetical protein